MSSKDELHMQYKAETGQAYSEWTFEMYRSKGKWILDISDELKMELYGRLSWFDVPDLDYIEWLENKLIELQNGRNNSK
jgi:hypothetical protein